MLGTFVLLAAKLTLSVVLLLLLAFVFVFVLVFAFVWWPGDRGLRPRMEACRERARRLLPPAARLSILAAAALFGLGLLLTARAGDHPAALACAAAVLLLVCDVPRPSQASGASFTWLWWQHVAPIVNSGCEVPPGHPALRRAERQRPADVLTEPQWPSAWPFTPKDFRRRDERADDEFYRCAAFATHVDDAAIAALRTYYSTLPAFTEESGARILDLASSWISHYPEDLSEKQVARICGVGMHHDELARNPQLGSYVVRDLNRNSFQQPPRAADADADHSIQELLPYGDGSMDLVTCAVSIDYFIHPLVVLREVGRVLRPGGECHLSFSNRCFPTKVVGIWLSTNDSGHCWLVGSYFHFAGGFERIRVSDISPSRGHTDPMYVISAVKASG